MELPKEQVRQAPITQLIGWWNGNLPDGVESRVRFHIEVARTLRRRPEGLAFLKHQALSADMKKRARALMDLTYEECLDEEVISYFLAAFDSSEPPLKWCGLSCLRRIKYYLLNHDEVEGLFAQHEHLYGDLAVEAMLYLAEAFPAEAAAILKRGLQSDNRSIRGQACDGVSENRVYELLPDVEQLVNDTDWYVATEAKAATEMLRFFRKHP